MTVIKKITFSILFFSLFVISLLGLPSWTSLPWCILGLMLLITSWLLAVFNGGASLALYTKKIETKALYLSIVIIYSAKIGLAFL